MSTSLTQEYYINAPSSIIELIESRFDYWTSCDKRYLLVSLQLVTNEKDSIIGRNDFRIYGDTVEALVSFWNDYGRKRSDTTTQHFIVDCLERKVVTLLQICA